MSGLEARRIVLVVVVAAAVVVVKAMEGQHVRLVRNVIDAGVLVTGLEIALSQIVNDIIHAPDIVLDLGRDHDLIGTGEVSPRVDQGVEIGKENAVGEVRLTIGRKAEVQVGRKEQRLDLQVDLCLLLNLFLAHDPDPMVKDAGRKNPRSPKLVPQANLFQGALHLQSHIPEAIPQNTP